MALYLQKYILPLKILTSHEFSILSAAFHIVLPCRETRCTYPSAERWRNKVKFLDQIRSQGYTPFQSSLMNESTKFRHLKYPLASNEVSPSSLYPIHQKYRKRTVYEQSILLIFLSCTLDSCKIGNNHKRDHDDFQLQ